MLYYTEGCAWQRGSNLFLAEGHQLRVLVEGVHLHRHSRGHKPAVSDQLLQLVDCAVSQANGLHQTLVIQILKL